MSTARQNNSKHASKLATRSIADEIASELNSLLDRLGLNRRSAVKARRSAPTCNSIPYSSMAKLLADWHSDTRFVGQDGNPMPLAMSGKISFSRLSKLSAPEIEPEQMLVSLKRAGAIKLNKGKQVYVQARSLYVYKDRDLAAQYTASSLLSYIKTLSHNLDRQASMKQQLFNRMAVHEQFDRRLLPLLNLQVRRQGNALLESLDNWMIKKSGKKLSKTPLKVMVGIYLATDRPPI